MQCLFFIWRPDHHWSSEELQGLGKGVMGDSKFKNSNVHGSHSNILPLDPYSSTPIIRAN